jgi:hypothetical protein
LHQLQRKLIDGIARELHGEGVPSPGSSWKGRKIRRCNGWMGIFVSRLNHTA